MKITDNITLDNTTENVKNPSPKKPTIVSDKPKKSAKSRGRQEMEDLLNKTDITVPAVGDLIKGKVITVTNSAVYLDLGALGTGIIMGREMKDGLGIVENLNEGDEIEATVVELENDEGYVELSIREAAYEKAWG